MRYKNLKDLLSNRDGVLSRGPIALIMVEDLTEVESTLRHHLAAGFVSVVAFAPDALVLPDDLGASVHRVDYDVTQPRAIEIAVNAVNDAAPDTWIYYCYNAEYLFFPFCESRSVAEMLAFHTEERRDAVLTYIVDLYAGDLEQHPNAVTLDDAHLDGTGYYALARPDENKEPKERQLDFYGGLRWRFEEHIVQSRRKIDRIALFKAKPGLQLNANHTFNDEEYNTYACPWHNNITIAIASFRMAKALKTNAGSTFDIETFTWRNSARFEWSSQQLMDLGLMEPGQWF